MSKTEAQYTNVIIALLDVCLEKESFLFERPRGITRVFKTRRCAKKCGMQSWIFARKS